MVTDEVKKTVEESQDLDPNQIEKALALIDSEVSSIKDETYALKTTKTDEIKEKSKDIDDLTDIALDKMKKVDSTTDEIYQLFYQPIALRQDRSDASKIALLDSQHIKVDLINAVTNLITAKAKLEAARAKVAIGNVGVFVGTKDGNEVGINVSSMKDYDKEDEEDD